MASIFDDYKPGSPSPASPAAPAASTAPSSSRSGIFKDYTPAAQAPAAASSAPPAAPPDNPNAYHPGFLGKFTNEMEDALTFGLADTATAKVGNWLSYLGVPNATPNVDAMRAQTQQYRKDIGPVAATVADVAPMFAGGVATRGPAMVADAARAATGGSRLAGWGAGTLASGAQGAGSGALGTLGHGGSAQDAESAAGWGAVLGLGTGALGVGSARPRGAPTLSAAEAEAARELAYVPMASVQFHPDDVDPAYTSALLNLGKDQRAGLSDGFQSTLREHLGQNAIGTTSASDIDGFARGVREAARTNADSVVAGRISDNLRGVLENATPVSGHAPGTAALMQDGANAAQARFKNAQMLEEWRRQANLPTSGGIGEVAPSGAYSELKANPQFYSDPDVNAAMRGVAGAGGMIPGGWLIKHAVAYPAIGAGIGALGGGATGYFGAGKGEDPWSRALEEAAVFAGGGLAAGYGGGAARNALTNRALRAAGPTLTSGAPYAAAPTAFRDAVRNLIYGQGAAGNL